VHDIIQIRSSGSVGLRVLCGIVLPVFNMGCGEYFAGYCCQPHGTLFMDLDNMTVVCGVKWFVFSRSPYGIIRFCFSRFMVVERVHYEAWGSIGVRIPLRSLVRV
jgi:hypothetical protein